MTQYAEEDSIGHITLSTFGEFGESGHNPARQVRLLDFGSSVLHDLPYHPLRKQHQCMENQISVRCGTPGTNENPNVAIFYTMSRGRMSTKGMDTATEMTIGSLMDSITFEGRRQVREGEGEELSKRKVMQVQL